MTVRIRSMAAGVAALLAVVFHAACPSQGDYVPPEEVRSDLPRGDPSTVPSGDVNELVAGNTEFSFDLLHALASENGDLFYSPYSITQALAMTYAGARGDTAAQMVDVLHFTLPPERLHPAFNRLDQELRASGQDADEPFELHLANAIWAQAGFELDQAFLDTLAVHYGAGVYLADFAGAPEAARETINTWVSDQTEDRINDLLPSGVINPDVLLVLTNAIYFKAAWMHKFDEDHTRDEDFYPEGGGVVQVPMMQQQRNFSYVLGDGLQALEMPYDGGDLSMVVVLPDPGLFDEISTTLDGSTLGGLIAGLQTQYVHLELPRFTYDSSFQLETTLGVLGMDDAFDPTHADFTGMSSWPGLYIMSVVHKAFVYVHEAGTEAAAATAVVMGADASAPPTPVEFIVDRPFLFLIRDRGTGTILFLGRVEDPS